MNTQINLRLPEKMLVSAKKHANKHGFGTVQEFIKETLREKLFGSDLTQEEFKLVQKLIKISDEKNLYGTEEDLKKALSR
ncbi:MAG: hypothetical protein V1914_00960 [archaeon]